MRTHILGARLIDPASGHDQVTYGIAVRMAVLSMAMSGQAAQRQMNQEAEELN